MAKTCTICGTKYSSKDIEMCSICRNADDLFNEQWYRRPCDRCGKSINMDNDNTLCRKCSHRKKRKK